MGNQADEHGTDVEIYFRPFPPTVHIDTPTGAPAALHDMLDRLGLERHTDNFGDLTFIHHRAPEHLDIHEQKRVASAAIPALLLAGYKTSCSPRVFDQAAFETAALKLRADESRAVEQSDQAASATPAPAGRSL
ncbi:hypothetical protein ACFQ8Q_00285 [Streptomyces cyaneofuscatus]|uniref:hypothetical protein n=1 Tax=Streptomyces cyaneofuscatus TaxID=66883 RepID=UPI00367BD906